MSQIIERIDTYLIEAKIEVWDSGDKYADRYTVFIGNDVYGMSTNPHSPQGFNQYSGSRSEIKPGKHLGKKLTGIPKEIAKAVKERMKE